MKIFLFCFAGIFFSMQKSHSQASLMVHDSRYVTTTPDSYMQNLQVNFKTGASVSLPETYYTVIGLRGWVDNTGGKTHELAFLHKVMYYSDRDIHPYGKIGENFW